MRHPHQRDCWSLHRLRASDKGFKALSLSRDWGRSYHCPLLRYHLLNLSFCDHMTHKKRKPSGLSFAFWWLRRMPALSFLRLALCIPESNTKSLGFLPTKNLCLRTWSYRYCNTNSQARTDCKRNRQRCLLHVFSGLGSVLQLTSRARSDVSKKKYLTK